MVTDDPLQISLPGAGRISGRQLYWLLFSLLAGLILTALAVGCWEFNETQRIWKVIDANGGFTTLASGAIAIGDSYGTGDGISGRPLFRYQVVKLHIGSLGNGKHVDFSQPTRLGEQHPLSVLERLPNLSDVVVWSSRISSEGTTCLARCRRLNSLYIDVAAKELTPEQLQPLAACSSLQNLTISGPSLSGTAIAQLKPLSNLEQLTLWSAEIDELGMLEISRLRSLRNLVFCYTKFEPSTLECLAEMPNLESLSIDGCDPRRETYHAIGQMTRLRSLYLRIGMGDENDRPTCGEEFTELSGLTELRDLDFRAGRLTGTSLDTLLCFKNVETLFVESDFTDDEAIQLANGLNAKVFAVESPKFNDPQRICDAVTGKTLYYCHRAWLQPGYVIANRELR